MHSNNIYRYNCSDGGHSDRGGYGYQRYGYSHEETPTLHNSPSYDKGTRATEEDIDLLDSICLDKDWNAEFQACLETEDSVDKFRKLSNLARDFSYAAKVYGSIIISEYYVSSEKKTIKPVVIGGIAGGHKYIALGILFKFALDTKGLYGGDANAMKAAAHELKGLMSYYNCYVPQLHVPLMAIIDYHGFRLLAVSVLPIDKVIVYGSRDAGKTVYASNSEMNFLMRSAATRMNLKEHIVGKQNVSLHSCGDIEGHLGTDNRFYLLDFARVFPPQYRLTNVGPPSHLFCLLRPELVKSNPVPLCSDALTGWVMSDPEYHIHNKEVKDATARLLHTVIPKFARWLDDWMEENSMKFPNKKNRAVLPDIIEDLHRHGINVRHLGFVLYKVKSLPMQTALLTEIIARIVKCEILEQFRIKMQEYRIPCEEPYKETAVNCLNMVISRDTVGSDGDLRGRFWGAGLQHKIAQKFSVVYGSLNMYEEDPNCEEIFGAEAQQRVDLWQLVKRFLALTGVTLTRSARVDLKENMGLFYLHQDDIEAITGKCKFMNIIEHASGMVLFAEAEQRPPKEAKRLFTLASSRFRAALATFPLSVGTLYQWAYMLTKMAPRSEDNAEKSSLFKEAEEKLRYVLEIVPDYTDAKITLATLLYNYGTHLIDDLKPEAADKSARMCEVLLAEALSLDVMELGEKCEIFNNLSRAAFLYAALASKESTFKTERHAFLAAHVRLKALQSFHGAHLCESRLRGLITRHIKLLMRQHASCLSHMRGDLAHGLMAHAGACMKRVHPDQDLWHFFQSMHTKWQLVTLFLLSREVAPECVASVVHRLKAVTSFSMKIKGLPPMLLGRSLEGEAPLASLLDTLRYVRFLVLDSMPISDAIMSFLYHNFEQMDSLSVAGCRNITFIVPTSPNYNKGNSRNVLQPPVLSVASANDPLSTPASSVSTHSPPTYKRNSLNLTDYTDTRSLTSSSSSGYSTGMYGGGTYANISIYDEVNLHNPDMVNLHIRPSTPNSPRGGGDSLNDSSSDCSTPPISPRTSSDFLTQQQGNYANLRGGTPPPILHESTTPSPPTRATMHTGVRSSSDSAAPIPGTKLRRSSSTDNTPQSMGMGTTMGPAKRSASESSGSPTHSPFHLFRSGSWGDGSNSSSSSSSSGNTNTKRSSGRISLGLGRSGSGDLTGNSDTNNNSNNNSPPTNSDNGSNNASAYISIPTPQRISGKRLIGIGRHSTNSTELSTSGGAESPSRSRHSLKMFTLMRSGSSELPVIDAPIYSHTNSNNNNTTLTSNNTSSGSSLRHSGNSNGNNTSDSNSNTSDSNINNTSGSNTNSNTSTNSNNNSGSICAHECHYPKPEKGGKPCKFSEMQFLNCSNCTSLLDKSLQAIALQKLPLQCVYLGGCSKISDAGLIPLCNSCPQLKVLEINDCYKITDASILEIARNCTELKELNVASCKINASSIERLAKGCPNLVSLNTMGVEAITDNTLKIIAHKCTNMHILKLGHCPNVTDTGIFALASKLASSLQTLTISNPTSPNGPKVTDASITALGNACTNLRILKLRNSGVSHNSVIGLLQGNNMLTRLDLGGSHQVGNPIFDSLLRSGQHIRVLKVAQCYGISNTIAFSDPYDLFANQPGLKNLTTLDWSDTNLTNKVLENVCKHCVKVTKLKIQGCKLVTNQAMGYISKHLTALQKLRIDRCPQIDDGGIALLHSDSTARLLATLSLIRVAISNKSIDVLSRFESLQNLHLSNVGNLTPDAIEKLLESCVELQHVYFVLQNANTETNKFLELRQKFPRVKLYFVESGNRK